MIIAGIVVTCSGSSDHSGDHHITSDTHHRCLLELPSCTMHLAWLTVTNAVTAGIPMAYSYSVSTFYSGEWPAMCHVWLTNAVTAGIAAAFLLVLFTVMNDQQCIMFDWQMMSLLELQWLIVIQLVLFTVMTNKQCVMSDWQMLSLLESR